MKVLAFLLSFLLINSAASQTVNVNCIFQQIGNIYACILAGLSLPNVNESTVFNIGGVHTPGNTNANVTGAVVFNSNVPIIISALFTTFHNLENFEIYSSVHPMRIQSGAFRDAGNLRIITIKGTPLTTIPANAFDGASRVEMMFLERNLIRNVNRNALLGLPQLNYLYLSYNEIRNIEPAFLRTAPSLIEVELDYNQIVRLPVGFIQFNHQLRVFSARNNTILMAPPNFFDGITTLQRFSLAGNQCVNQDWNNIGTPGNTLDNIRAAMAGCFANYANFNNQRQYGMNLSGMLTLKSYDNGDIVLRL